MADRRAGSSGDELPTGTVTFLFTDIEGSTRLSQALGADFASVIDRHHEVLRQAISSAEGIVVSTEGDAVFAVFRHARAAVEGAVTAQRRILSEAWPGTSALRVRMGLHTGEGRLGGDDYAGVDVNRAARLSSVGHGGQVLISATSAAHLATGLPDAVALRDLGEIRLKDFDEFETVYQLDVDGLPNDFPALRADRPGSLPEPLTSFIGREDEIEEVAARLHDDRLVTLTGPGGSGKTRLSIEVAREAGPGFAGGAWFVPLQAVAAARLVLPEIADRLEVRGATEASLHEALVERIGRRDTLLVLDNLEQVIEVGPALARILREASTLRILATSREALRVDGEREVPVSILAPDVAVRLFVERARQVRPGLAGGAEAGPVIGEIVERLDRLPLAIELAAARVKLFAPGALLQRLDQRLGLLTAGSRDVPDRQRTLRAAIDWSYQLLDEDERRLFARLSVFAGASRLESVEAVVDGGDLGTDTLSGLASLVDKSLVVMQDDAAGEPRMRMLQTLREYAAERLDDDPVGPEVHERHARHFVAFAEEIEPLLVGADVRAAAERVDRDHANLRAAIDWSLGADHPDLGLRIGAAIWRYWQNRAQMADAAERMEALLAHPLAEDDPRWMARGATALGGIVYWQGRYEAARDIYERAVEGYRTAGDEAGIAQALYDLSFPIAILGDDATARELMEESLERYTELGDERGIALCKEALALVHLIGGDLDRAWELESDAVAFYRSRHIQQKMTDGLMLSAVIQVRRGETASARQLLDEGATLTSEIADLSGRAGILEIGAMVALEEGRPEVAAILGGALQALRDQGEPFLTATSALRQPDPIPVAKERLGEHFDASFEEGRRLTIEAAVDVAILGRVADG